MNYDDIIDLKRPISKYPKMNKNSRASQFMPFAALDGFSQSTKETEIEYDTKINLSIDQINELNLKLQKYTESQKEAKFIFFKPVNGNLGYYIDFINIIKRIEDGSIIFINNDKLEISNLINIKDI